MGWLSTLFVNPGTVKKVVDAGISAGDKVWYTDEEKADTDLKIKAWYIDLLASMKPFNVAMRLLAVGVFSIWALHLLLSTLAYILAFFVCDPALDYCSITNIATALESQMSRHINDHFGTIIMFYFGAAGVNSVVATAVNKK